MYLQLCSISGDCGDTVIHLVDISRQNICTTTNKFVRYDRYYGSNECIRDVDLYHYPCDMIPWVVKCRGWLAV